MLHLSRRIRGTEKLGESRFCVLKALKGGPMSISELAEHERVSTPSMSKLVGSMTDSGLVERVRDTADGRRVEVSLTQLGRDTFLEASASGTTRIENYLGGLKEEDIQVLARAAELMRGMSTT